MSDALSGQQLAEIAARAAHLWEYVTQSDEADELAGTDVPALLVEVERLTARVAELEAAAEKVAAFVAGRAEVITAINNCHPDNAHDYDRWQGHAEARRVLAETLGLPVAWPVEGGAS